MPRELYSIRGSEVEDARILEGLVSALGGNPPPGYGVHPDEANYWSDSVRYAVHPLTGKEEAVGGLFHRFWREHVEELKRMRNAGWPHVEIVRTAKELWKRQQEASKKDEELVRQHKETMHAQRKQDIANVYGATPPANEAGLSPAPGNAPPMEMGPPGAETLVRGLSMDGDKDYRMRLEDFRGKHYTRDATGASVQQILRGSNIRESQNYHAPQMGRNGFSKAGGGEPGVKMSPFSLPSLPYSYDAFEPVIDASTMRMHHKEHHRGYTQRLNELLKESSLAVETIEEILSRIFRMIGSVKQAAEIRDQGGGYYNHNLWFDVIVPGGTSAPRGPLVNHLKRDFGGLSGLKREFAKVEAQRFGAGWVWLALTPQGDLVVYNTANQDSPIMWEDIPILGIDLWEHAYYRTYGPDRKGWLQAFWGIVNWRNVEQRYEKAMGGLKKGFGVIVENEEGEVEKGDTTGGERALTPEQLKREKDFSFTRKETGVSNSPFTSIVSADDETT